MTVFLLKIIVSTWKIISFPVLGERCRYYPSCSDYLLKAVEVHGVIGGFGLGFKRVCKCHPLSEGGPDFVPEKIIKR